MKRNASKQTLKTEISGPHRPGGKQIAAGTPAKAGTPLSAAERRNLRQCEITIEYGFDSFRKAGLALLQVQDEKLYRQSYKSFEAYLADRWNLKRQRGYELIKAAGIAQRMSEISDTPVRESHAAALAALPPEKQAKAWQAAIESAPDEEPSPFELMDSVIEHLQRVEDTLTENPLPEDEIEDFVAKLDQARSLFYRIAKSFNSAPA